MPGLEQRQNQRQTLQQSAILSARQQLGLTLLAMPVLKLEDAIQQELATNPLLESVLPDIPGKQDGGDYEDDLSSKEDRYYDFSAQPFSGEDRKQEFLNNLPAPKLTLRGLLISEADNSDIPDRLKIPVFEIISSLDPNGFLSVPLADLAMSMPEDADVDLEDIKAALELVRKLAPAEIWIGYRCDFFKQKLAEIGKLTPKFSALCDELELLPDGIGGAELKEHFLPGLSAKLDIAPAELEKMLAVIQEFKVNHLAEFEPEESGAVFPDLEIVKLPDGGFAVNVLRENSRKIVIVERYEKLSKDPKLSPKDKEYFNEKMASAKNFIQALAMRESTLERLGKLIVERQKDFFDNGVSGLKGFTMSEAAELLNVNPSTVTRAVDEKYAATPRGVYPLRFFFPGNAAKNDSGERSRNAVLEDIRRIIDNENPALPLSDDRISEILREEGVQISRRTVAKYRTILNIPGASERKHFKH